MGFQAGLDSVFGLHHLTHARNAETQGDPLAGTMPAPSAISPDPAPPSVRPGTQTRIVTHE